jgi:hypothetical protein
MTASKAEKPKTPEKKKITPDALVRNDEIELTEGELKRVSGGVDDESYGAKH